MLRLLSDSGPHGVEQHVCIHRFVQECNRTSGQSLRASFFAAMRGEEDDRNSPTVRNQIVLQLQAVHPGYPPVENQASDRWEIPAMQSPNGIRGPNLTTYGRSRRSYRRVVNSGRPARPADRAAGTPRPHGWLGGDAGAVVS